MTLKQDSKYEETVPLKTVYKVLKRKVGIRLSFIKEKADNWLDTGPSLFDFYERLKRRIVQE